MARTALQPDSSNPGATVDEFNPPSGRRDVGAAEPAVARDDGFPDRLCMDAGLFRDLVDTVRVRTQFFSQLRHFHSWIRPRGIHRADAWRVGGSLSRGPG